MSSAELRPKSPQDSACLIVIVIVTASLDIPQFVKHERFSTCYFSPRSALPTLNFCKICATAECKDFDLSRRICPILLDAQCNEGPWKLMNSSSTNMPGRESQKHLAQLNKARSLCNPRVRRLHSQRRAVSPCMATTGTPPNTHTNSNTEDSHVTNAMPVSRNIRKCLLRSRGWQNCPLSWCCWHWQHQKLHIAELQLLETPAEMTICTNATFCPR